MPRRILAVTGTLSGRSGQAHRRNDRMASSSSRRTAEQAPGAAADAGSRSALASRKFRSMAGGDELREACSVRSAMQAGSLAEQAAPPPACRPWSAAAACSDSGEIRRSGAMLRQQRLPQTRTNPGHRLARNHRRCRAPRATRRRRGLPIGRAGVGT